MRPATVTTLVALQVALPLSAQAGGCDFPRETEIVGLSPDGGAYALRTRHYFTIEDMEFLRKDCSLCDYPKVNGKCHDGVRLELVQSPPAYRHLGSWDVYPVTNYDPHTMPDNCTSHAEASEQLNRAKEAFAQAGVDLQVVPKPLAKVSRKELIARLGQDAAEKNSYRLPPDVTKKLGIGDFVVVRDGNRRSPAHGAALSPGILVEAPGFGVVRHDSGGLCNSCSREAYLLGPTGILFRLMEIHSDCGPAVADVVRVETLAARLLNSRGFERHKKKDYQGSASDFASAFKLDPTYAQAAFNLACARTLVKDTNGALDALESAISLDAKRFKRKAKRDSDLDGLRDNKRFQALLAR